MDVVVYSTPTCVACKQTYRALDKMGIEYKIVDMSTDASVLDHIRSLGFLQAPVVESGSDMWSGFRPDKLNSLTQIAA